MPAGVGSNKNRNGKRQRKSYWNPAAAKQHADEDKEGGASAGVAIFVRDYVGFNSVQKGAPVHLVESRLSAALVCLPGMGPMVVYVAYFHTGSGQKDKNLALLDAIADHLAEHEHPWVVAADWNATAQELFTRDMLEQFGARVVQPTEETCVSPTSARVLDYFFVEMDSEQQ